MKRIFSLLLCLCLLLSGAPAVCGSGSEARTSAERLHSLGLLSGVGTLPDGSIDFGLELPLSREQAVVMLLRLIGREQESEGMELNMPFSDVSPWAAKSVAYAHSLGLAQGIAPGLFGGRDSLSAAAYLTFVLRALGYSSEEDFSWFEPWLLSDSIGLTQGQYGPDSGFFTRGDMAIISSRALDTPIKDSSLTLLESLGAEDDAKKSAERLHALGLLSGIGIFPDGSTDFGLQQPLSREQGVVMLLRLMGREAESEGMELNMPFSDVSPWAAQSVAYAYSLGLAKGYSGTLFGGRDSLSTAGYLSFVLRALGYSSEEDFSWREPWLLSDSIGLTHGQYGPNSTFTRGDMAIISSRALDTPLKGSSLTLLESSRPLPSHGDPEKAQRIESNLSALRENYPRFGFPDFFAPVLGEGEIKALLESSPEDLASALKTPGDVLHYLALSDYSVSALGRQFYEDGCPWQLSESPACTISGNSGTSSATASLLSFLLAEDFQELGCITHSYPAIMGGGHSLSYIVHEGIFYVFDLSAIVESGYSENGAFCSGSSLEEAALNWAGQSGAYAQHIFSSPGKALPWACSGETLILPLQYQSSITLIYEDSGFGCDSRWQSMGQGLLAELEAMEKAPAAPPLASPKGNIGERLLSDGLLRALRYSDKNTLRAYISTAADAAAYLDQFIYEFSALDKGLKTDLDYLLSQHFRGYTAPETYTAFAFRCLSDDIPGMRCLLASADSPQGARLYSCLLIPSEDGYTIVNPSAFSSHPNPVYGFEEKTVSDLNSIEADFVPLHDWSSESFELYQLLSFSPYPEKASFAFDGKYINVPDWAREEYRK